MSELLQLTTTATRHFGLDIKEYTLTVPWDWDAFDTDPAARRTLESFELYARELIPAGGADLPMLVYLQGGPGCAAPRPLNAGGIIGEMLKHYRVLLLDQRGTGRSHPIDGTSPEADRTATRLLQLRQEHIVRDAEALRLALSESPWALYGQSYGGFLIMSYLSQFPESVTRAYMTGGMPALTASVDEVYHATYTQIAARHHRWFQEYPWTQARIREICTHLDATEEFLPTGERLTSRRFRMLGIQLGRGEGPHNLAYLLEHPFHDHRLQANFLAEVGAQLSNQARPLYAAIHEAIYGGCGGQAQTNWSAHRVREAIPGFQETVPPASASKEAYYLTGEHMFPWLFEEDPALAPFAAAAQHLAAHQWSSAPYHLDTLRALDTPIAATMYADDIFVPLVLSQASAAELRNVRPHITNQWQHDGIRHAGAQLFATMHRSLEEW